MEVEDERERKEKRKEGGHLLLCSPFIPFQENVVLQTFTCTVKATVPCTCSTTFTELWGERFKKDQYNIALCHRKLCMQMKTMSLAHDSCHFLAMVHITLIKRTERMKSSPIPRGGGIRLLLAYRPHQLQQPAQHQHPPSHLLQVPPLQVWKVLEKLLLRLLLIKHAHTKNHPWVLSVVLLFSGLFVLIQKLHN